mmetsp:Transcript_21673/g.40459  ORF Transcript_21673/g.40459 Transcript_21673/m.40459 type:complete len:147 (+) Transcript_21673:1332-1772(+)
MQLLVDVTVRSQQHNSNIVVTPGNHTWRSQNYALKADQLQLNRLSESLLYCPSLQSLKLSTVSQTMTKYTTKSIKRQQRQIEDTGTTRLFCILQYYCIFPKRHNILKLLGLANHSVTKINCLEWTSLAIYVVTPLSLFHRPHVRSS